MARKLASSLSLQVFYPEGHKGRLAFIQARRSAATARYFNNPPLRLISRIMVEADLLRFLAIALKDKLAEIPRDISSRSSKDKTLEERFGVGGFIPPVFCKEQNTEAACLFSCRPISLNDLPSDHSCHIVSC